MDALLSVQVPLAMHRGGRQHHTFAQRSEDVLQHTRQLLAYSSCAP